MTDLATQTKALLDAFNADPGACKGDLIEALTQLYAGAPAQQQGQGGPAFPTTADADNWGMTLRDYFAAKALTIIAAAGGIDHIGPIECASAAFEIADAMLAERAK